MSKELVISTKDFNEVGINAQLSVNDLVEVVANDIYEKFIATMHESVEHSKEVIKMWKNLFDTEIEGMRQQLIQAGLLKESEEYGKSYGRDKTYWNDGIYVKFFTLEERDKGIKISANDKYFSFPSGTKSKVKLEITVSGYDNDRKINEGDITGSVEVRTSKRFSKTILVSSKKFTQMVILTNENNDRLEELRKKLPNGLLSVERFTREARIKMNKKIIASQSPDFRDKISELFQIKL